jgi:hypothetical protein
MLNKKFISYLKASYLLHLITLSEIACFGCLYYSFDVLSWLRNDLSVLKLIALSPAVCMPLFAQLDARSRYQNYKLVKDHLYIYGFQTKTLKPFLKSRCQRDAAKAAANELGMLQQCNEYFKSNGYRWYHLFPDVVFKKPSILFSKFFWATTLFTKTYHSKIDFEKINFFVPAGSCVAFK